MYQSAIISTNLFCVTIGWATSARLAKAQLANSWRSAELASPNKYWIISLGLDAVGCA
ncbi:Uncharacterised protein [Vibrio cholerae]|nr:Uncharacterised protein [Vibrio cholerae]